MAIYPTSSSAKVMPAHLSALRTSCRPRMVVRRYLPSRVIQNSNDISISIRSRSIILNGGISQTPSPNSFVAKLNANELSNVLHHPLPLPLIAGHLSHSLQHVLRALFKPIHEILPKRHQRFLHLLPPTRQRSPRQASLKATVASQRAAASTLTARCFSPSRSVPSPRTPHIRFIGSGCVALNGEWNGLRGAGSWIW